MDNCSKHKKILFDVPFVFCMLLIAGIIFFPQTGIITTKFPTPILIPIFCLVLLLVVLWRYHDVALGKWVKILVPLLGCMILGSAVLHLESYEPIVRGGISYLLGVSGFFCGLYLFRSRERLLMLFWWMTGILALYLLVCLISAIFTGSAHYPFVKLHKHAQVAFITFLSFGPLSLLLMNTGKIRLFCSLLLVVPFAVFFLVQSRVGIILPFAILPVLVFSMRVKIKYLAGGLCAALVICVLFFMATPALDAFKTTHESAFFRAENPFFAFHVMRDSPQNFLLGAGVRTDKAKYLNDYEMTFSWVPKDRYAGVLGRIMTMDNIYTSIAMDLGAPFFLLYCGTLAVLFWRALLRCRRNPPISSLKSGTLVMGILLLHFLVFDGLYFGFIPFFFHLLVGIVAALTTDNEFAYDLRPLN